MEWNWHKGGGEMIARKMYPPGSRASRPGRQSRDTQRHGSDVDVKFYVDIEFES